MLQPDQRSQWIHVSFYLFNSFKEHPFRSKGSAKIKRYLFRASPNHKNLKKIELKCWFNRYILDFQMYKFNPQD